MVAKKIGKTLLRRRGDQRLPATLQRVDIRPRAHSREEVVFQQIGRRELQATGVERLEQGVRVELVVHRDENEEQAAGHCFRQDLRDFLAFVLPVSFQLVDLLRKIPVALPQERVRPRQAARIERIPELHQVVLVERVVGFVQVQPAALDERRRVLFADEAVAQLRGALPVPLIVRASIRHAPQLVDDRQRQQGDGRQPLLAVDDEELAVTVRLHNQGAHVMTAVGLAAQLDDVVPEIFPLLLRPGIVALVRRHAVRLAVADQLQVAGRPRVEDVGSAHRFSRLAAPYARRRVLVPSPKHHFGMAGFCYGLLGAVTARSTVAATPRLRPVTRDGRIARPP